MDVTSEGLFAGQSPNGKMVELFDHVAAEGTRLVAENEQPPIEEYEWACQHLGEGHEFNYVLLHDNDD